MMFFINSLVKFAESQVLKFLINAELPLAIRDIMDRYNYVPSDQNYQNRTGIHDRQPTVQELQKISCKQNEIFFLALDALTAMIIKGRML